MHIINQLSSNIPLQTLIGDNTLNKHKGTLIHRDIVQNLASGGNICPYLEPYFDKMNSL